MGEIIVAPDPVLLTISWLTGQFPWPVNVTKNRPNPVSGRVVAVRRNGGTAPDVVTDSAWLYIECFADTDFDASELGHFTWGLVLAMKGETIDGCPCYDVTAISGPQDFPDADASQPRFVMSAAVDIRAAAV